MKVTTLLDEIKNIDHKILSELESESLCVDNLNELYELRKSYVQGLSEYTLDSSDFSFNKLDASSKKNIADSLTLIHLLEKKINMKLTAALEHRAQTLERISVTKRARYSYSRAYEQEPTSLYVDINHS
jgi:hypothetical protein